MTSPTDPAPLDLLLRGDAATAAGIIAGAALLSLALDVPCGCENRVHCFEHGDREHVHPHSGMAAEFDRGDLSYPGCAACACEDYCLDVVGHGCDVCMGPDEPDPGPYTIEASAPC